MPATEHQAPSSPAGSSVSDGSSSNSISTGPPRTPVSSSSPPLSMPSFMNFTGKETLNGVASLSGANRTLKTTRRVNTAERRATHNAVERQRRETLNGRFLDLASMLSNLSQIRRPSKSVIVNSSIAHVKAGHRHRYMAAQQLRILKHEADALRHEINEWRARAGVAPAEEPVRSDAFGLVIHGELEFEAGDMVDGEEGEDDEDSGGGNVRVYEGMRYAAEPAQYTAEEFDDYALLQRQHEEYAEMIAAQMHAPFAHTRHHPSPPPHTQGHPMHQGPPYPSAHYYTTEPTVVHPDLILFEDTAIGYDHHPSMYPDQWVYEKQQQILHAQQQRQGSW